MSEDQDEVIGGTDEGRIPWTGLLRRARFENGELVREHLMPSSSSVGLASSETKCFNVNPEVGMKKPLKLVRRLTTHATGQTHKSPERSKIDMLKSAIRHPHCPMKKETHIDKSFATTKGTQTVSHHRTYHNDYMQPPQPEFVPITRHSTVQGYDFDREHHLDPKRPAGWVDPSHMPMPSSGLQNYSLGPRCQTYYYCPSCGYKMPFSKELINQMYRQINPTQFSQHHLPMPQNPFNPPMMYCPQMYPGYNYMEQFAPRAY